MSSEEGEVYQIFLMSVVIFTRDSLTGEETGNKANPTEVAPNMKHLRYR